MYGRVCYFSPCPSCVQTTDESDSEEDEDHPAVMLISSNPKSKPSLAPHLLRPPSAKPSSFVKNNGTKAPASMSSDAGLLSSNVTKTSFSQASKQPEKPTSMKVDV